MFNQLLKKYNDLLTLEGQSLWRPEQCVVLMSKLGDFLEAHYESLHEQTDILNIQTLSDLLLRLYIGDVQQGNWERRATYIRASDFLSKVQGNTYADQLKDKGREYIGNATYESISLINNGTLGSLIVLNPNEFRNLAVRDLRILKVGKQYLPANEIPSLVINLLDTQKNVESSQKEKYFDEVFALIPDDQALKERFYADLMETKPQQPDLSKKYARSYKMFNSEQRKGLKS